MSYLIANSRAIIFEVAKKEDLKITIFSIDTNTRLYTKIADDMPVGFGYCYNKIIEFYNSQGWSLENWKFTGDMLSKHIKQYKDNLYGLHLAQKSNLEEDLRLHFFRESYVSCFAMEISGILSNMHKNDLTNIENHIKEEIRSESSDSLELETFLFQWRLADRRKP